MTFRPQIVREDEAELYEQLGQTPPAEGEPGDGDLPLSDDLAALGSQLAGEAESLAARYPAEPLWRHTPCGEFAARRAAPLSGGGPHGRTPRYLGPALAVLIAVAAGSVYFWGSPWTGLAVKPKREPDVHRSAPEAVTIGYRPARDHADETRSSAPQSVSLPAAPSEPVSHVQELTGPELEGYLDLLEGEGAAASRLSI